MCSSTTAACHSTGPQLQLSLYPDRTLQSQLLSASFHATESLQTANSHADWRDSFVVLDELATHKLKLCRSFGLASYIPFTIVQASKIVKNLVDQHSELVRQGNLKVCTCSHKLRRKDLHTEAFLEHIFALQPSAVRC